MVRVGRPDGNENEIDRPFHVDVVKTQAQARRLD